MHVVDSLHSLVRHTLAHCRRETIAFGRRVNAMVERAMLLIIWRNFVKRVSERRPAAATAAMNVRLADEPWTWDRVLARRLFPDRVSTPPGWDRVYRRDWVTTSIGPNTRHRCRFAF
jgi:hypothetical protein